jgi:hypothetical protein
MIMTRESRTPGRACASHAGDGTLAIANFSGPASRPILSNAWPNTEKKFVAARRRDQRARRTRSPALRNDTVAESVNRRFEQ